MHIAFVSESDPTQVRSWSGIPNAIFRALQAAGHSVTAIVPTRPSQVDLKKRLSRRLLPQPRDGRYLEQYTAWSLKGLARSTGRHLQALPIRPDLVLSIHPDPIAHLKWDGPIIVTGDATFPGLVDYYPAFGGLSGRTIRDGTAMARRGLQRAELTVLSSDWARETVAEHFPALIHKVRVIPFGANLDQAPDPQYVEAAIEQRHFSNGISLLAVGVEWYRKGLDRAVALAARLNELGLPTTLHLVGCRWPDEEPYLPFIHNYGFLNKSKPEDLSILKTLWFGSHFFVLPSRAECCAIAFAEAAAYGLPSLTTREGGIPTAVCDDSNGFLFEGEQFVEQASQCLQQLYQHPAEYQQLCRSALQVSQHRLNWRAYVADLEKLALPLVSLRCA